MSQIFKEGSNWVIVSHINDLSFTDEVKKSVTQEDWSAYTSAKGPNSKQHYIINPSWMPMQSFTEPTGWPALRERMGSIVQNEIVNYGLMPHNWIKLHACSAWTVLGDEGSYHTIHDHGPMNVCSVLYLEVPEPQEVENEHDLWKDKSGQIYFVMHGSSYNNLGVPNFRVFHVSPKKGMLVIFPSWMLHGVYPQGPGLRQTLNIDFNGDPNYQFNVPHSGGASYN